MKLLGRLKAKKALAAALLALIMVPMTMVVAFANDGGESIGIDYSFIFSEAMLEPLVEGITSNVLILLPVCLGLFVIFIGIRVIRNIFLNFSGVLFCARKDAQSYGVGTVWDWVPLYLKPSILFRDLFR